MRFRGINYDTGTFYVPGHLSRPDWSETLMVEQIRTISEELHCNAVNVFGSDVGRIVATAEVALEAGLNVWVQPRLPDATTSATLQHFEDVAVAAEVLRVGQARLALNLGCELTVFTAGLLPGNGYEQRAQALRWAWWLLLPLANRRLNRLLADAVAVTRATFSGEITYSAGSWETVEWSRFDVVGLNLYRDASNSASYTRTLKSAHRHGQPLLVTEFGCCSYTGADLVGPEGDGIVDWTDPSRPRVRGTPERDEHVQARYLGELLDIFQTTDVVGAFVFEYTEPEYPRSDDPRYDLDIGGFGLVAVRLQESLEGTHYTYEPKAAFHEVARRYELLHRRESPPV